MKGHVIDYQIIGDDTHLVEVELDPEGGSAKGSVLGRLGRMLGGD
jgi:hypothetical protein